MMTWCDWFSSLRTVTRVQNGFNLWDWLTVSAQSMWQSKKKKQPMRELHSFSHAPLSDEFKMATAQEGNKAIKQSQDSCPLNLECNHYFNFKTTLWVKLPCSHPFSCKDVPIEDDKKRRRNQKGCIFTFLPRKSLLPWQGSTMGLLHYIFFFNNIL